MAWRSSMSTGVKGGMKLMTVAKAPLGLVITGMRMSSGITIGSTRTMARFCASCGLLQAAPRADAKLLSMVTWATR